MNVESLVIYFRLVLEIKTVIGSREKKNLRTGKLQSDIHES